MLNIRILFLVLISNYKFIYSSNFDYTIDIPHGKDNIYVTQFVNDLKGVYLTDNLLFIFIPELLWMSQINNSNLTKFVLFEDLKSDCLSVYYNYKYRKSDSPHFHDNPNYNLTILYKHLVINFIEFSSFLNSEIKIVFESTKNPKIIIYKIV